MSEPIYSTRMHDLGLPFQIIAGALHLENGTFSDVAVHPRGCSICERAIELTKRLGFSIPPLYVDESKIYRKPLGGTDASTVAKESK